jgi:prepilin-type N-terminal cleavage/methylation domain-containing protein
MHKAGRYAGFTVIELSIVLVIIGLLAGGILAGSELIRASEVRAQLSQYEKYNVAINTFRLKFDGFPGDIKASDAQSIGLVARSGDNGHGDGDRILENCDDNPVEWPFGCEFVLFWSDLSKTNLIEGNFPGAVDGYPVIQKFSDSLNYFPLVKVNNAETLVVATDASGHPWYVDLRVNEFHARGNYQPDMGFRMKPSSAYNIDIKLDDGNPIAGNVFVTVPFGNGFGTGSQFLWNMFEDPGMQDRDETCVYDNKYNLINNGAFYCGLAVKVHY